MKNIFRLLLLALGLMIVSSGCNSTKYASGAQHDRGVNNKHFVGY